MFCHSSYYFDGDHGQVRSIVRWQKGVRAKKIQVKYICSSKNVNFEEEKVVDTCEICNNNKTLFPIPFETKILQTTNVA